MKTHFILYVSIFAFIIGSLIGCSDSNNPTASVPVQTEEELAIESVVEFIERVYPEMIESPNSLQVTRIKHFETGWWRLEFDQTYSSYRVRSGRATVILRSDLTVRSFDNYIFPDVNVHVFPAIMLEEAVNIGKANQLELDRDEGILSEEELMIFPSHIYNFVLSWSYLLTTEWSGNSWRYYIDAHNGEIIWVRRVS